jgi:hypothetical protein
MMKAQSARTRRPRHVRASDAGDEADVGLEEHYLLLEVVRRVDRLNLVGVLHRRHRTGEGDEVSAAIRGRARVEHTRSTSRLPPKKALRVAWGAGRVHLGCDDEGL